MHRTATGPKATGFHAEWSRKRAGGVCYIAAMRCRLGLLTALAVVACSSKSDIKGNGTPQVVSDAPKPTFTLFALAELRGQIGPCGCTSDPLGDISRTAQLVADARAKGPTLVLDAGSFLYGRDPIPPHLQNQEELKADLIARTYQDVLAVGAAGLGPADLARGTEKLRLPRNVVNVKTPLADAGARIVEAGSSKVGVFGVVGNGAVQKLETTDPVAAGKAAVADLRKQGAQVVVGLVQATSKAEAVKLMRDIGGLDFAIAGLGAAAPEPDRVENEATKVGDGWLVIPANRGQVVPRLDITLRGAGPFADAIGPGAAKPKLESLARRLNDLDADLARFAKDPSADPAFVKQKQSERASLAAERDKLAKTPLSLPASGNYFTMEQIRIAKTLPCEPKVNDQITAFYRAAGEANVKAAAGIKPPPAAKGQAAYVGSAACEDCHADAVEFWNKTRHANAWETLEVRGQQFDFDCINCHVTGWDKPGGSNLAFNDTLRDVQCETCHGPGSLHVARGGEETPKSIVRNPPPDMCATQCHTKEHSDTFQYDAYMRDIVGPGHGEALRKALGDGPTGFHLRKEALDKAGRNIGANCTRK